MKNATDFEQYSILGLNNGEKLEQWNNIILLRPDPEIIWESKMPKIAIDAKYKRSKEGGGSWEIYNKNIPEKWQIKYQDMIFNLKLMGFKHTGLFPEQAVNWNLIRETIKKEDKEVKVLNLFAYTGAATVAALKENASVVHVDSSKGIIQWAKENVISNNLQDKKVRFIVDDCIKFVKREIKRGNKYDIIIMDPPSFGRGANGEVWNIEKDLYNLVKMCTELLTDKPLLFLINSYTTGLSKIVLENILNLTVNKKIKGKISSYELTIKCQNNNIYLPCGISAKWEQ